MILGLTVSLIVLIAVVIVAALGYVIDRSGESS
jgi:hypothetical protein